MQVQDRSCLNFSHVMDGVRRRGSQSLRRGFLTVVAVFVSVGLNLPAAHAQCDVYSSSAGPMPYTPGTTDIGNHSPQATTQIDLPFQVTIYGVSYTTAYASTEGYLHFSAAAVSSAQANQCLPDARFEAPSLFPYWDNLTTVGAAEGQGIFVGLFGPAGERTFVVEWRVRFGTLSTAPDRNFEIVFHENQNYFDFVYGPMPSDVLRTDTVGIQASPVGPVTQLECNPFADPSIAQTGTSIRFTSVPQPPPGACCALGTCTVTCPQFCYSDFTSGETCTPNPCPSSPTAGQCWEYELAPGVGSFTPGDTDIGNHSNDSAATSVALPFAVSLFGASYTQATVGTDGFIEFGSDAQAADDNGCLPDARFLGPTIFAFWQRLDTTHDGHGIFTSVSGSVGDRAFAIEWRARKPSYGPQYFYDFSVVFYENQSFFDVIYASLPSGDQTQTVGVQASVTGPVTTYRCMDSERRVSNGLAIRYSCDGWAGGACCSAGACTTVNTVSECSTGSFTLGGLCSPEQCAPANDFCDNALDLNAPDYPALDPWFRLTLDNWNAGDELTDCTTLYRAVWFKYIASEPTLLTFEGGNNTAWATTSDCESLPLCSFGTYGAVSLATGETVMLVAGNLLPPDGPSSQLNLYFRVDSLAVPANDTCQGAFDMSVIPPDQQADIYSYDFAAAEDATDCGPIYGGVWFTYSTPTPAVIRYEGNPETAWATSSNCGDLPHCLDTRTGLIQVAAGETVKLLGGKGVPITDPLDERQFGFTIRPAVACCAYGMCTITSEPCDSPAVPGGTCNPNPCPGPPAGTCWQYDVNPVSTAYVSASTDIGNHDTGADPLTPLSLPFPVTLFGAPVEAVNVSSNGFVSVGGTHQDDFYSCLPNAEFASPTIFPHWGSLRTDGVEAGQGVFTELLGQPGSRRFVVEWRANWWGDGVGAPLVNFEIMFYENQSYFDVVYNTVAPGGQPETVGVQASPTGPISQYRCADVGGGAITAGLALRFSCPVTCAADFNGSGGVSVQDIFDFLAAYFSGAPQADFNGSGGVTVQDIFDYLAAYFTGC